MSEFAPVIVRPTNQASWADLSEIFGQRGCGSRCWCQRYKLAPGESFGSFPVEERAHRLRARTECEHPEATVTAGLVGYLDAEPVGWCAVEPRSRLDGLIRVYRVPWDGRREDRDDPSVWAVTCLFTRAGRRRRGVSRAMALAAGRLRPRPGRQCPGGISHHHHPGDRGGAARRDGGDVRRGGPGRGQPADATPGGHAHRLPI